MIYLNKFNYSKKNNIVGQCPICLDQNIILLLLNCMHQVCICCYPDYIKCGICK